jgi:hydrogenase maturation protein HypF
VRARLAGRGFQVYAPALYPPNDGGIALGQVLVAARRAKEAADVPRHPG